MFSCINVFLLIGCYVVKISKQYGS